MTVLKAPMPYFGGKSKIAHLVWQRLGNADNYVEPFAGSLAVLLGRPSAPQTETVNDYNGYISNVWRAIQADPDAVAHYADWPVNECDLHARHRWLVNQADFRERMLTDPDYYDAKIAGWWVWGASAWIGSGWCDYEKVGRLASQRSHLTHADGDYAVSNKRPAEGRGINRQLPRVTGDQGINRKLPHVGNDGRGVHRPNQPLYDYFHQLAERLRRVRVCCGDWSRVCTPAVTVGMGLTGVFCLHPDTLVRTDNEQFVYIRNIQAGDVLHGGRTVKQAMNRQYEGEMIELAIQSLPDSLVVTPEHRLVRIPKRTGKRQDSRTDIEMWNQREEVQADQLETGDYLFVPLGGNQYQFAWEWDDSLQLRGVRQKQVVFNPASDLYRLIGYYAAEGHVRYKNGSPNGVNFTFSRDEEQTYVKDLMEIVEKTFGVTPTLRWNNPGSINVWIGSTSIARFFAHYVAGDAITKRLHPHLMTCAIEDQMKILIGWMRGDGGLWLDSRNRCKLTGTSASEGLARQMFTLALRCGLRPSFKRRQKTYDVYFASEDAQKLGWSVSAVKFRSTRRVINDHLLVRVKAVSRQTYNGAVYDLDVDADDLFAAPYALVHNCDPPYSAESDRDNSLYAVESTSVAHDVRQWCIENGDNPLLRIALCGYSGEGHEELEPLGWTAVPWKANGGYGNQGEGRGAKNAKREVVWFSPHCLKATLFDLDSF